MLRVCIILFLSTFGLTINAADRAVTKITGDVYRFQNDFHYSVLVLTDEGVVVTDPINAEAAAWLKTEIEKMTDRPITHLIYSHSHDDHASGGSAFGNVPTVIAHANAPAKIDGVSPTQRFDETLLVESGGKKIELIYLGPGHGDDLIAMIIRPENVGFIVDAAGVRRLPYQDMPGTNPDELLEQMRKVETLDFEIFAGGHGAVGDKKDATPVRVYLEELRAKVLAGLKEGKSDQELWESIPMRKYEKWGFVYDSWRVMNIRGMARHLRAIGEVD